MLRKQEAIKKWLPIAAIVAVTSFIITYVFNVPIERVLTATAMAGIMVFSGFFFRSFGKDKKDYE